jgi:hypothetical protein
MQLYLGFYFKKLLLHVFLCKLYVTVRYTNGSLCSNVIPEDGHDERPKRVEVLEIKAKIQLHLIGYVCTY